PQSRALGSAMSSLCVLPVSVGVRGRRLRGIRLCPCHAAAVNDEDNDREHGDGERRDQPPNERIGEVIVARHSPGGGNRLVLSEEVPRDCGAVESAVVVGDGAGKLDAEGRGRGTWHWLVARIHPRGLNALDEEGITVPNHGEQAT